MPRKKPEAPKRNPAAHDVHAPTDEPSAILLRVRHAETGVTERIPIPDARATTLNDLRALVRVKIGEGTLHNVPNPVPPFRSGSPLGELLPDHTPLSLTEDISNGALLLLQPTASAPRRNPRRSPRTPYPPSPPLPPSRRAAKRTEPSRPRPAPKRPRQVSALTFPDFTAADTHDVAASYRAGGAATAGSAAFDAFAAAAREEAVAWCDGPRGRRWRDAMREGGEGDGAGEVPWVRVDKERVGEYPEAGRVLVRFRGANPKPREESVPWLDRRMVVDVVRAVLVGAPRKRVVRKDGESEVEVRMRALKMEWVQMSEMAKRWPPLLWSVWCEADSTDTKVVEAWDALIREAAGSIPLVD